MYQGPVCQGPNGSNRPGLGSQPVHPLPIGLHTQLKFRSGHSILALAMLEKEVIWVLSSGWILAQYCKYFISVSWLELASD